MVILKILKLLSLGLATLLILGVVYTFVAKALLNERPIYIVFALFTLIVWFAMLIWVAPYIGKEG